MKKMLCIFCLGTFAPLRIALGAQQADLNSPLKLYRDYGLPLPAKDARLVQYSYPGISIVNGVEQKPRQHLAFLVKEERDSIVLLVGPIMKRMGKNEISWKVVPPSAIEPEKIEMESFGLSVFEVNTRLAVAIQLNAQGERSLATVFFNGCLTEGCGHHFSLFVQPAGLSPEKGVAHLAWAWLANRLLDPESSRTELLQTARKVIKAVPELETEASKSFIASLEASLARTTSKPGSVEGLIHALIDVTQNAGMHTQGDEFDPRVEAIITRGFDAIPALLNHLDDKRLTRSVQQGFNNFPSWHRRVSHVVSDILQGLAGEEFKRDWLQAQTGYGIDRQAVDDWWMRTKEISERDYFQKYALGGDSEWPNLTILRVLRVKYPETLAPLYRELVEKHPKKVSQPLAEELAKSDRPAEEKRAAFLYAVTNATGDVQSTGLGHLNKSDPKAFNHFLLQSLTNMASTPKGEYWTCPEAHLTHLVVETDSTEVWAAFLAAAKRADVGLRMELMNPLNYSYVEDRLLRQRLQFLSAFLDDETERDATSAPAKFTGPFAGFVFPKLRVCDLAAELVGSLVGLDQQPRPSWTRQEWEDYRARVKKELSTKLRELK
jgi:hypothetical protein